MIAKLPELVDLARPWVGTRHEEEAMRDLILKMSISIDGFVGGPDGGIKWVFGSDQEAKVLDRRDRMERQPAHYGQPDLP
jgi:hypothetical protein